MDYYSEKNREWANMNFNEETIKKSWKNSLELFFND